MTRFFPKSLLGQVMLALVCGLLVGQAIAGVLLYRSAEQRRETSLAHAISFRILSADQRIERRDRHLQHQPRGKRYRSRFLAGVERRTGPPAQSGDERLGDLEKTLEDVFADQGMEVSDLMVLRRKAGNDAFIDRRARLKLQADGHKWREHNIIIAGIQQVSGGQWKVVRIPEPRPPRSVIGGIILQTLVIFAVLVTLLYLLLRRITRPLAQLTTRLDDFARNPALAEPIPESGPDDIRHLIAAHNGMEARIATLIDEKDVMLGAIGHDLKTPLAALRVRVETVTDPDQRARMAESIEDITRTLDDILNLARVGRSNDPMERTDLAALAAAVVEEYEDMGMPVDLRGMQRLALPMRATWLRRAIRNLIDNALRYGKQARVEVLGEGPSAIVRIDDDGPGIPESEIAAMLEPFARGETSRNRATGGAGLGLTLARAIAEQHGGSLVLSNREQGGLRAEIRLPF